MISGKVWGRTFLVYSDDHCEVQYMECNKGKKCSEHEHRHKFNIFWCISGKIKIKVWKNDYDLVDETILEPYQSMQVKYGEYHTFEVLEDAQVLEVYYVKLLLDDIVRRSCGGLVDNIDKSKCPSNETVNEFVANNDNIEYEN